MGKSHHQRLPADVVVSKPVTGEPSVTPEPVAESHFEVSVSVSVSMSVSEGDGLSDWFGPWFGDGLAKDQGLALLQKGEGEGERDGEEDLLLSLQEESSQNHFLEFHLLAPGDPGIGFGGQRDQHQDDGGHDEEKRSGPHFAQEVLSLKLNSRWIHSPRELN